MSNNNRQFQLKKYDFSEKIDAGLLIVAGGFEQRSLTFIKKLSEKNTVFDQVLIFQYKSQYEDNLQNFTELSKLVSKITKNKIKIVPIDLSYPLKSCDDIKNAIKLESDHILNKNAYIDISGLTNLFFTTAIHSLLNTFSKVNVIYTESKYYYPYRQDRDKIVKAWRNRDYDTAAEYLQSKGLGDIIIHPEFQGNFRPGKQTCLIIFVGYEPNRVKGLIDEYAPGKLIVYYGISPHKEFFWRTQFSKDLHEDLFSDWYVHEAETSTMELNEINKKIKEDCEIIQENYDIAIAPQNSKMQALASYLFWRQHPEVQLIFTTPIKFKPNTYSKKSKNTFEIQLK